MYYLGQARRSFWRSLWENLKREWARADFQAKLTFIPRAIWALFMIGLKQRKIVLIMIAVVAAVTIGFIAYRTITWVPMDLDLPSIEYPTPSIITLIWVVAFAAWVYLKGKYPGQYATIKGQTRSGSAVRLTPFWIALALTLLVQGLKTLLTSLTWPTWAVGNLVAWVIASLVLLSIVGMLMGKERIRTYTERYRTDLTVIAIAGFGIVVINLLAYFLTTARPRIWLWYWSNQAFFWAFSLGWLAVAYLHSKRDGGKVIPTAATIRNLVMIALLLGFGVNLFYYRTTPLIIPEPAPTPIPIAQPSLTPRIEAILAPVGEWSKPYDRMKGMKVRFEEDGKRYLIEVTYYTIDEDTKEKVYLEETWELGSGTETIKIKGTIESVRVKSSEKEPVVVQVTLTPK